MLAIRYRWRLRGPRRMVVDVSSEDLEAYEYYLAESLYPAS